MVTAKVAEEGKPPVQGKKGSSSRSPTEQLSFADPEFLMRDEMRASRLALEFTKAELSLLDAGIQSTVVVFGSSRAVSAEEAEKRASAARGKDALAAANRHKKLSAWYEHARDFGRIVSQKGGARSGEQGIRDNVITTGGGPGIMEAANRGAVDAGAPSIGFNITLPDEQSPNEFLSPGLSIHFHYFAVRKMHFAMRANALAVFPGGYGTLDELFDILNLKQAHKTPAMPVILFGRDYWKSIVDFEALASFGTIDASDLALFEVVDSAEEGWQAMLDLGLAPQTPLRDA
jgi:uncharacterized protein (TIGR00730 family)